MLSSLQPGQNVLLFKKFCQIQSSSGLHMAFLDYIHKFQLFSQQIEDVNLRSAKQNTYPSLCGSEQKSLQLQL
jgi:hypothetical protein